jgi:hypothetical protein
MNEPRRGDTVYGLGGRRRILAVNNPGGRADRTRHCFVVLDDLTMIRVDHLVQVGFRTWRARP